ncbi:hypothetical protein H0251_09670 [Pectobacterium carotovorum]|uniref:hypothetical protein n=1 Tax=Pectobacterium carotovorum TaxID=554 RepID=UPI0015DD701C|nr:hypothetical protein [Pectobacterium carotovorum]MBA0179900.1 hypothetical protein [Pectobacterium carotovorum]
MNLVIDANVFKGFYQEYVLELPEHDTSLTGSTLKLFDANNKIIYMDEGTQIENEWRRVVCPEWFDAWLIGELEAGHVVNIPTKNQEIILNALKKQGFPSSGDKWYVRTAVTLKEEQDEVNFITEDIDFYDPTKKSLKNAKRVCIMKSKSSTIRKYLSKKTGLIVMPVCEFNDL